MFYKILFLNLFFIGVISSSLVWADTRLSPEQVLDEAYEISFGKALLTLSTSAGTQQWMLEVAQTPEQLARGLMFRRSLPDQTGMVFLFPYPRQVTMWMKNTFISLDMLFFDESGRIVYLIENAEPESTHLLKCPVFVSGVVELPGGSIKTYGIKMGSLLKLQLQKPES